MYLKKTGMLGSVFQLDDCQGKGVDHQIADDSAAERTSLPWRLLLPGGSEESTINARSKRPMVWGNHMSIFVVGVLPPDRGKNGRRGAWHQGQERAAKAHYTIHHQNRLLHTRSCCLLTWCTDTPALVDVPRVFRLNERLNSKKKRVWFVSQWCTLKALWVKSPCPLVILLVGLLVQCTQSHLRVLRRWPPPLTHCIDDCLTITSLPTSLFFLRQEQKDTRQQRLEVLSKIEKVQCGWIGSSFTVSSTLWFPNKTFCSSVVRSSSGGGGEGQDEKCSAAWSRGKKAGGRDAEESGPNLLTVAAPRVPVSSMKLAFHVTHNKSKFIKKIHVFACIMFVWNGHTTIFPAMFSSRDSGGEFLPFLAVSKGKKLFARLLPFLKHHKALTILRVVTANLPTLMSRDAEEVAASVPVPFGILLPLFSSLPGQIDTSNFWKCKVVA